MKLPEVKGRNKVRDLKICYGWSVENLTEEELGKRFQMTKQGISRILRNNKDLLKIDKDYEKKKRLHYLGRMLTKHNLVLGKKSSIDIVEQMRKEIEGDKPLVDNSVHQQFVIYRNPEAIKEDNIGRRAEIKDADLQAR